MSENPFYVHHLSIGVSDLERSRDFYRDWLGYRPIHRPDLGFPGAWLKLGTTQLHLIQREGAVPEELPSSVHTAFQLADVESMDRYEERLKDAGLEYRRGVQRSSGIHQIFFQDPDGYHIEIGAYPD